MRWPSIDSAEAEPDWLTVVTEGEVDGLKSRSIFEIVSATATRRNGWSVMGYRGSICGDLPDIGGGVAWGCKNLLEASLMQSWGQLSYRVGRMYRDALCGRVSRCDLAVTVLFEVATPPLRKWPIAYQLETREDIRLVLPGGEEGGTLYVGNRGSDCFGRVYDKGAELGTIPPCLFWRWEVEYKRQAAQTMALGCWGEDDGRARQRYIGREVAAWFTKREVPLPNWLGDQLGYPVLRYSTRVRSDQTTLKWLRDQVRPAVRRLHEHGHEDQIKKSLGIGASLVLLLDQYDDGEPVSTQTDFFASMQHPV